MPKITFIEFDGVSHAVNAEAGITLMEAARNSDISGIDAECGGAGICATCHVIVDDAWQQLIGPASGTELEMLEFTGGCAPGSRLSCQVQITAEMDGLVLTVPESQG